MSILQNKMMMKLELQRCLEVSAMAANKPFSILNWDWSLEYTIRIVRPNGFQVKELGPPATTYQMDFRLIQDCSKSDRWAHLRCAGVRMKPFLLTLAPEIGVACVELKVTRGLV